MPGLAVIAHTVWGAAGSSLHDPRNRLGDALGRRLDLAVAVESGRITAVVPAAEVAALGADRVVDLGDATLMPGFVDAHVHLSATGLADHGADLRAARSPAQMLDRVRTAAARDGAGGLLWGDGYDETRFEHPELPSPAELAEAAGGRPVYLSRVDGHQGLATLDVLGDSGALEATGCDRDQAGDPTGVTRGDANHLARRFALATLPAATLLAAQDAALSRRPGAGWPASTRWPAPTSPAVATSSCCWTGSRPCPSRWSATGATWISSMWPPASWPRSAATCSWTGRSAPTPPPSPPPTRTGPTPAV